VTRGAGDETRADAPLSLALLQAGPRHSESRGPRRVESRREPRQETVRRVEYTAFPRVGSDTGTRVGFTRNVSQSGMALGVEEPLPVGSLVRVVVQHVDGRPDFDAVARVAWARDGHEAARPTPDPAEGPGAHRMLRAGNRPGAAPWWLGLVLVAEVRRGLARVPGKTATPARGSA